MRRKFLSVAAFAFAALLPAAGLAQYPNKPIRFVVPFAAGGPTDAIARAISERMRVSLGQPILIENTTGAGGSIGVTRAVRSAPPVITLKVHSGVSACLR